MTLDMMEHDHEWGLKKDKMFVVRSGLNWDNPKIKFITEYENIALAIIDADRNKHYDDYIKMNKSMVSLYQEKLDFYDFKINRGDTLNQWEKDEIDRNKSQLEHYSKIPSYEEYVKSRARNFKDEDMKKRYGFEWYYEEVNIVNDLDAALELFKEGILR